MERRTHTNTPDARRVAGELGVWHTSPQPRCEKVGNGPSRQDVARGWVLWAWDEDEATAIQATLNDQLRQAVKRLCGGRTPSKPEMVGRGVSTQRRHHGTGKPSKSAGN